MKPEPSRLRRREWEEERTAEDKTSIPRARLPLSGFLHTLPFTPFCAAAAAAVAAAEEEAAAPAASLHRLFSLRCFRIRDARVWRG